MSDFKLTYDKDLALAKIQSTDGVLQILYTLELIALLNGILYESLMAMLTKFECQ